MMTRPPRLQKQLTAPLIRKAMPRNPEMVMELILGAMFGLELKTLFSSKTFAWRVTLVLPSVRDGDQVRRGDVSVPSDSVYINMLVCRAA